MWNELKNYGWQYTILILGVLVFALLFMFAWPNHAWQRVVALAFGGAYFLWGTATHLHAQHLTKHLLWEYFSVGLLVSSLLLMMTW